MGREMETSIEDYEKHQGVNVHKMGIDPQIPGPSPARLGTNFMQGRKSKSHKDGEKKKEGMILELSPCLYGTPLRCRKRGK
jgi:C-terminal processing protease CtpA/Prc